jgi:pimeloyl-ACP methyl ester carboxylesterase
LVRGLTPEARRLFEARAEARISTSFRELDVTQLPKRLSTTPVALVVHDRADRDVPFSHGEALTTSWPGARLLPVERLGHRRILKSPAAVQSVAEFVAA